MAWVGRQRCVWHIWRSLGREVSRAAAKGVEGLVGEAATSLRDQIRAELLALVRAVINAKSFPVGEQALAALRAHPQGTRI